MIEVYVYYDGDVLTDDSPARSCRYKSSNLGTKENPAFITLTVPKEMFPKRRAFKVQVPFPET